MQQCQVEFDSADEYFFHPQRRDFVREEAIKITNSKTTKRKTLNNKKRQKMQRWFFGEENRTSEVLHRVQLNETSGGGGGRKHTFRVLVNQHLESFEWVAVTGECSSLGNWLPAHCVPLHRENGEFFFSANFYCFGEKKNEFVEKAFSVSWH